MTNERNEKALEAADWIDHKGKRRPVHRDELVNVQFRGGKADPNIQVTAENLDWVHRGDRADIVAYRLVLSTLHHRRITP